MTLVSQLIPVLEECEQRRDNRHPAHDASREFALAATALEEAIMRINRGFAKINRSFIIADVESQIE